MAVNWIIKFGFVADDSEVFRYLLEDERSLIV